MKKRNEVKRMIAINKAEKEAIVERFPEVHIVRTMKQKSKRHRYYCEERKQVVQFLNALRENTLTEKKEGGNHKSGKKTR